jgi:hypothetical protein
MLFYSIADLSRSRLILQLLQILYSRSSWMRLWWACGYWFPRQLGKPSSKCTSHVRHASGSCDAVPLNCMSCLTTKSARGDSLRQRLQRSVYSKSKKRRSWIIEKIDRCCMEMSEYISLIHWRLQRKCRLLKRSFGVYDRLTKTTPKITSQHLILHRSIRIIIKHTELRLQTCYAGPIFLALYLMLIRSLKLYTDASKWFCSVENGKHGPVETFLINASTLK